MEPDTTEVDSAEAKIAEPPRRCAAWAIDAAIAGVLFMPLNPILYSRRPSIGLVVALLAPSLLLLCVYLVLFDGGERGATPGKRLLGLRVLDEFGADTIGYRRAAIRRVTYLIGGLAIYLGWLWIFVDDRHQAWHDKAAHTIVVYT